MGYAQTQERVEAGFEERYGGFRPGPHSQSVPDEDGNEDYFG